MKKYLLKILLFFAIVVAIDFCFGSVCDYLVAHAKGGSNKQLNDLCMNDQYDILVMGSSRARHHYDPRIIEDSLGMSCYNAGYDGNGIILADGLYSIISERYKPKMIVYDLTLGFDCYEYLEDQHDKRYISQIKPYYKHQQIQDIVYRISPEEYYKLASGLIRNNCKTINLVKENVITTPTDDDGFIPLKGKMGYEPTNYEELAANSMVDSTKMFFLEDFIQRVKQDSVHLVFAISPRYKSSSKEMYLELEKMCAKYNVTLLDFYNDVNLSTDKSLYEDIAHLNEEGAKEFTSEFCVALKKYLLKN